jgi:signal transduction histidine kinase
LRWYAGEITRNYDLPVSLNGVGNGLKLTPDERVVFFRIAQEAITNVIRHADATQASITLESSADRVQLIIEDDGKGFNVAGMLDQESLGPHWGLLGMIERAALIGGTCRITSNVGQGTRVEVSLVREAGHG